MSLTSRALTAAVGTHAVQRPQDAAAHHRQNGGRHRQGPAQHGHQQQFYQPQLAFHHGLERGCQFLGGMDQ